MPRKHRKSIRDGCGVLQVGLSYDSQSDYFKEQKIKFQNSKDEEKL